MDPDSDPLAINPSDLSSFGDSCNNIEIVIESDDEVDQNRLSTSGSIDDEEEVNSVSSMDEPDNITDVTEYSIVTNLKSDAKGDYKVMDIIDVKPISPRRNSIGPSHSDKKILKRKIETSALQINAKRQTTEIKKSSGRSEEDPARRFQAKTKNKPTLLPKLVKSNQFNDIENMLTPNIIPKKDTVLQTNKSSVSQVNTSATPIILQSIQGQNMSTPNLIPKTEQVAPTNISSVAQVNTSATPIMLRNIQGQNINSPVLLINNPTPGSNKPCFLILQPVPAAAVNAQMNIPVQTIVPTAIGNLQNPTNVLGQPTKITTNILSSMLTKSTVSDVRKLNENSESMARSNIQSKKVDSYTYQKKNVATIINSNIAVPPATDNLQKSTNLVGNTSKTPTPSVFNKSVVHNIRKQIENLESRVKSDLDKLAVSTSRSSNPTGISDAQSRGVETGTYQRESQNILNFSNIRVKQCYPSASSKRQIKKPELGETSLKALEEVNAISHEEISLDSKDDDIIIIVDEASNKENQDAGNNSDTPIEDVDGVCYVPGCRTKKDGKSYFFGVPIDLNLKRMWDISIDNPYKRLGKGDIVCEHHFPQNCVIRNKGSENEPKLKKGAVPCFQFHQKCCVPNCRTTSGRMYSFPILNKANLELWLYMVKNPTLRTLSVRELLRHRVCSRHFEADCFESNFDLTKLAAPTLALPETTEVLKTPVENKVPNVAKSVASTRSAATVSFLTCAYRNCYSRSSCSKKIFWFPTDINKCNTWLKAAGREDLIKDTAGKTRTAISTAKYGVCEDHFDIREFETSTILKVDAVPKVSEFQGDVTVDLKEQSVTNKVNKSSEARKDLLIYNQSVVQKCSYLNCNTTTESDPVIKLFYFPAHDVNRSEEWIANSGNDKLKELSPHDLSKQFICSLHFKRLDLVSENLSRTAVPLRYDLVKASSLIFENGDFTRKSKVFPNVCFYMDCHNTPTENVKFYSFPSDPKRYKLWLEACGYENFGNVMVKYEICKEHFAPSMFDGDKLKDFAVPIPSNQVISEPVSDSKDKDGYHGHSQSHEKLFCAVEKCYTVYSKISTRGVSHMFPDPNKDLDRYNIWILLVQNQYLKNLNTKSIRSRYIVCNRHFEMHFYKGEGHCADLSSEAVPTINLTADINWFFISDYYRTRLQKYFDDLEIDDSDDVVEWRESPAIAIDEKQDKKKCILERDRLNFPGMGRHLYMGTKNLLKSKRTFPYGVYKYKGSGYGQTNDIEVGENVFIHTAIIIDDDDECERAVIQHLLDKRAKT